MSGRFRVAAAALAGALMLFGAQAHAFFPKGDFTEQGQLRYLVWPLSDMDIDGDGDVTGEDEGIEIVFEDNWIDYSGDEPVEYGWTEDELEVLEEGFEIWESVPTSYMSFTYAEPVNDDNMRVREPDPLDTPIIIHEAVDIDFRNYVCVEEEGDLPYGLFAIAVMTAVSEDIEFVDGGNSLWVTGGRIIDCDIVFDGPQHRSVQSGIPANKSLLATTVQYAGHLIGLNDTPLHNLSEGPWDGHDRNLEMPVLYWYNAQGDIDHIGATPSMFPAIFYLDDGTTDFPEGAETLAPDDISGISFLYPRGSQSDFFDIESEARTKTINGFPSLPVAGGHVVAWADTDDNPRTERVPLFSTMTGLYEDEEVMSGQFQLKGLRKQQLENDDEQKPQYFTMSYVLTVAPLTTREDATYLPDEISRPLFFDSTHALLGSQTGVFEYNTAFVSEVFHEEGNIANAEENHDDGTPLEWDALRNRVVSADTGTALSALVSTARPMFGSANSVCPLNVTAASLVSTKGSGLARRLRDTALLKSAAGVALIDAYYRVSPVMARFLIEHRGALTVAQGMYRGVEWVYTYAQSLALGVLALIVVLAGLNVRRRHAAALTALALVAGLALAAAPASAQIANLSTPEMVAKSDDIIVGAVSNVESRWVGEPAEGSSLPGRRIVTDITVTVQDTVKGNLNKSGKVFLCQPGGRVGPFVTTATYLADFKRGEEVLLFLQNKSVAKRIAPVVVAGQRGKYLVETDPDTGKKTVSSGTLAAKLGLADAEKAVESEEGAAAETKADGAVALDELVDYLRGVVNDQKKK